MERLQFKETFYQLIGSDIKISRYEMISLFILYCFSIAVFSDFQMAIVLFHHLDTTFLMEVLSSINENGIPVTHLGPSFIDVSGTFKLDADTLCAADLNPSGRGLSVLDSHAYLFLYLMSVFTWFFSPQSIASFANGLSFVTIIFTVYWIVRKQGVAILGAACFSLLVMSHPAWTHSSLGDLYLDRFFMPFALIYAYLVYRLINHECNPKPRSILIVILFGVLAASTTERAAIMISFYTLAMLLLYRHKNYSQKLKKVFIVFSLILLLYVVLYSVYFHVNYSGTGSLSSLVSGVFGFFDRLSNPTFASNLNEFLVINILLFGIVSVFNWRLGLIALAVLMPNILTTVGGAEKTGWATHYHSMYFPFLVFTTAMGFSCLWAKGEKYKLWFRPLLISFYIILSLLISNYSTGYGLEKGILTRIYEFYSKGDQSYEKYIQNQYKKIADAIPEDVTVTTTEAYMSALYSNRIINYYPLGIDTSDFAVINYQLSTEGTYIYTGAVSYIAGELNEINLCLNDRLESAGYDILNPELLIGNTAVLKRKK